MARDAQTPACRPGSGSSTGRPADKLQYIAAGIASRRPRRTPICRRRTDNNKGPGSTAPLLGTSAVYFHTLGSFSRTTAYSAHYISNRIRSIVMRKAGTYDSIIKGLFQRNPQSLLLDLLTGGIPVRQILNVELAKVLERRADLVFLLEDETILHLEFQTRNDKEMPYREGIYGLLLGQKYKRRVRQTVIYLGQPKMRMPSQLDLGQTKVAYTLIDIRDIDARMFIERGRSADLPVAMLAGGGPERLTEILKRAANLTGSERQRVLAELIQLCGLRSLQQPLIMELKSMASPNDTFLMIPQVQDMIRNAIRSDRAQVLRDLLTVKFRTLPKWADEKLESATPAQVQRWLRKILTAETLEGVLGKK